MKRVKTHIKTFLLTLLCSFVGYNSFTQVGINTVTPADGAILDVSANDKGLLMPRIPLTGTNDATSINPISTSVIIYNTVSTGAPGFEVTPGFYYWNGLRWRRLFNQGYALEYTQGSETRANLVSTLYETLNDLDTGILNITVPYTGTYQIIVNAYYSVHNKNNASTVDAFGEASVRLQMRTGLLGAYNTLQEKYVTSSSKRILSTNVHSLGQNITIIENVELDATENYGFRVQGKEWNRQNTTGRGYFGRNSNILPGNSGVNDAMRGEMTITLIRQN